MTHSTAQPSSPRSDRLCGRIKVEPEDFVVEELPAYLPSGEGEHLFLWIEKRDVSAEYLTGLLSRTLGISRDAIGTAGQKDRRAVTRQWVSVPGEVESRLSALDELASQGLVKVLSSARHRNKLRTAHLVGNRFSILVRTEDPQALATATRIAERVRVEGVPNRYGDQRFGIGDSTLAWGRDLLTGARSAREIEPHRRRSFLRFALSAVQSDLFNAVIQLRENQGSLRCVLTGDVLQVIASGGCFLTEDPAVDQARVDSREIIPTGPMFGVKMKSPAGDALVLEQQVLSGSGVEMKHFEAFSQLMPGARRALVVYPSEVEVVADPLGVRVAFSLPPGAYATTVLEEFVEANLDEAGEEVLPTNDD
jgi:tRNA pseudouridine13 synthase